MRSTEKKLGLFGLLSLGAIVIVLTTFNFIQNLALFRSLNYQGTELNSKLIAIAVKTTVIGMVLSIILIILFMIFQKKRKLNMEGNELEGSNNINTLTSAKDNNKLLNKYKDLNDYAEEIGASMAELANFTDNQAVYIEQFTAALTEVSSGVQQTSENAQQAADFVASVNNAVRIFVDSIEEVASIAQEVSSESENAKATAKDGEKVITNAINEMSNVSLRIKELVEHITLLGESTHEIDKILEVINNISNQTNMLSLNASIEAARAGEYGKGFSVVARSIKELADKSKNATNNISVIIKNIQKSVEEAVSKSNNGLKELEVGMTLVKSTGDSIGEILLAVDKTYNHSITLTESTKIQDDTSREIMNSVNELNNVVQDISATTMQESAGMQQVASGVEIIKESIEEIAAANSEIITFASYICNTTKELLDNKAIS